MSNDKATQQLLEKLNKAALDGLKTSIKLIETEMLRLVQKDDAVFTNYKLMSRYQALEK